MNSQLSSLRTGMDIGSETEMRRRPCTQARSSSRPSWHLKAHCPKPWREMERWGRRQYLTLGFSCHVKCLLTEKVDGLLTSSLHCSQFYSSEPQVFQGENEKVAIIFWWFLFFCLLWRGGLRILTPAICLIQESQVPVLMDPEIASVYVTGKW